MAMEGSAAPLVRIDVEVDAFMAYGRLFLQLQTSGDLLRTPLLAQEPFDLLPGLPGNARTIGRALPVVSEFICLIRAVALQSAVASQFSGDRALVAIDNRSNPTLVMSGFHQSVYLISLFASKLRIVHLCASLTWRLKSTLTL